MTAYALVLTLITSYLIQSLLLPFPSIDNDYSLLLSLCYFVIIVFTTCDDLYHNHSIATMLTTITRMTGLIIGIQYAGTILVGENLICELVCVNDYIEDVATFTDRCNERRNIHKVSEFFSIKIYPLQYTSIWIILQG